jgi:DMSO/TMAO reductase YedYZ molybdopterin-dependent catalytic subunit
MDFRLPSILKGSRANLERIQERARALGKDAERLPPGQFLTQRWPVLHYGPVPHTRLADWDFRIFGLVKEPVRFTYNEFMALPKKTIMCDIHCVTRWSKFDMVFEGVPFTEVIRHAEVDPRARYVIVHAEYGFTTNLPLEVLMDDDVLFAHRANGADLTPEHGWPLRLVVPKRYFWKSAKWVRGIELSEHDRPGFWEQNGYHNNADPWKEERYQ